MSIVICALGTAIFFEFKHYKPKKDIVSTRCFAFMEQDELKPGPACIELWVINIIHHVQYIFGNKRWAQKLDQINSDHSP